MICYCAFLGHLYLFASGFFCFPSVDRVVSRSSCKSEITANRYGDCMFQHSERYFLWKLSAFFDTLYSVHSGQTQAQAA